jgi:hypothetical protein
VLLYGGANNIVIQQSAPATIRSTPKLSKGKGKGIGTEDGARPPSAGTSTAGPSRLPSPQQAGPNDNEDGPPNDPFEGMSEEQIFRIVTRPDEIEGVADWGIPPAVDPAQAPDALKVSLTAIRLGAPLISQSKVQQFLRLKYERGQHINTTLLSSSSFANPHIYSKLVSVVAAFQETQAHVVGRIRRHR